MSNNFTQKYNGSYTDFINSYNDLIAEDKDKKAKIIYESLLSNGSVNKINALCSKRLPNSPAGFNELNVLVHNMLKLIPTNKENKVKKSKFDFGMNNITYNDLYYFSDQSNEDMTKIYMFTKNPILIFFKMTMFNLKKFYYTNSFIKKLRNIVKKNMVEKILEEEKNNNSKTNKLNIDELRHNEMIVKNYYSSLIMEHLLNHNTRNSFSKDDLQKIYKQILILNKKTDDEI